MSVRRLSDTTHSLAARGLSGEFGRAAIPAGVTLNELIDTSALSEEMRARAGGPFHRPNGRPCASFPAKGVVGSATFREAITHTVPIWGQPSVSHTTAGLRRSSPNRLRRPCERQSTSAESAATSTKRAATSLAAMELCLDAAAIWHDRHLRHLRGLIAASTGDERGRLPARPAQPPRRPRAPPDHLRRGRAGALVPVRVPAPVRQLVGPRAGRRDAGALSAARPRPPASRPSMRRGRTSRTSGSGARSGSAAWSDTGAGDAQHYQNVVLGGVDAQGREVTNEVTYLVLDIIEELASSDYPVAVRLNRNSPARLLWRIAEVQRRGGGIVAVYNEEAVIEALCRFGYDLAEARHVHQRRLLGGADPRPNVLRLRPFDTLLILQQALGLGDGAGDTPEYADFESLYAAFRNRGLRRPSMPTTGALTGAASAATPRLWSPC